MKKKTKTAVFDASCQNQKSSRAWARVSFDGALRVDKKPSLGEIFSHQPDRCYAETLISLFWEVQKFVVGLRARIKATGALRAAAEEKTEEHFNSLPAPCLRLWSTLTRLYGKYKKDNHSRPKLVRFLRLEFGISFEEMRMRISAGLSIAIALLLLLLNKFLSRAKQRDNFLITNAVE